MPIFVVEDEQRKTRNPESLVILDHLIGVLRVLAHASSLTTTLLLESPTGDGLIQTIKPHAELAVAELAVFELAVFGQQGDAHLSC